MTTDLQGHVQDVPWDKIQNLTDLEGSHLKAKIIASFDPNFDPSLDPDKRVSMGRFTNGCEHLECTLFIGKTQYRDPFHAVPYESISNINEKVDVKKNGFHLFLPVSGWIEKIFPQIFQITDPAPQPSTTEPRQFLGLPSEVNKNRRGRGTLQPRLGSLHLPPTPTTPGKKALILCHNKPPDQHGFSDYIGTVLKDPKNWTIDTLDEVEFHPAFQKNGIRHIVTDMWSFVKDKQFHGSYATVFMLDCGGAWWDSPSVEQTIRMIAEVLPVVAVGGSLHVSKIMAMLNPDENERTVFVGTLANRIGDAFVVTSERLLHSELIVVKRK